MDQVRSVSRPPSSSVERSFGRAIMSCRWLLAPFYAGLGIGIVLLLIRFVRYGVSLLARTPQLQTDQVIIGVLRLIDLSLMASLVLMVIFAGYENFIAPLDSPTQQDRPEWMQRIGFGELKLQVMKIIVAISAIHLLEEFMDIEHVDNRELAWSVGIFMAFVSAGIILALIDRISHGNSH
jgi:uncharacterized protein (TIGR00645 family)